MDLEVTNLNKKNGLENKKEVKIETNPYSELSWVQIPLWFVFVADKEKLILTPPI